MTAIPSSLVRGLSERESLDPPIRTQMANEVIQVPNSPHFILFPVVSTQYLNPKSLASKCSRSTALQCPA